jgi:hypothetical protein
MNRTPQLKINLSPIDSINKWQALKPCQALISSCQHLSKKLRIHQVFLICGFLVNRITIHQVFLISLITGRYLLLNELKNALTDKSLTDCLDILELAGYKGDLAIFILSALQSLEVAV